MLSNYSTKSSEIKAPVLQRDTERDLRSPVVSWSYQGGCFCRIEGRVDNQCVIGYCMNIIWKLKKKEKNAVTLFNLRVYTLALLFYSLPYYCSLDAHKIQALFFPDIPCKTGGCL